MLKKLSNSEVETGLAYMNNLKLIFQRLQGGLEASWRGSEGVWEAKRAQEPKSSQKVPRRTPDGPPSSTRQLKNLWGEVPSVRHKSGGILFYGRDGEMVGAKLLFLDR